MVFCGGVRAVERLPIPCGTSLMEAEYDAIRRYGDYGFQPMTRRLIQNLGHCPGYDAVGRWPNSRGPEWSAIALENRLSFSLREAIMGAAQTVYRGGRS